MIIEFRAMVKKMMILEIHNCLQKFFLSSSYRFLVHFCTSPYLSWDKVMYKKSKWSYISFLSTYLFLYFTISTYLFLYITIFTYLSCSLPYLFFLVISPYHPHTFPWQLVTYEIFLTLVVFPYRKLMSFWITEIRIK